MTKLFQHALLLLLNLLLLLLVLRTPEPLCELCEKTKVESPRGRGPLGS
jgi:hypothetical protein